MMTPPSQARHMRMIQDSPWPTRVREIIVNRPTRTPRISLRPSASLMRNKPIAIQNMPTAMRTWETISTRGRAARAASTRTTTSNRTGGRPAMVIVEAHADAKGNKMRKNFTNHIATREGWELGRSARCASVVMPAPPSPFGRRRRRSCGRRRTSRPPNGPPPDESGRTWRHPSAPR